MGLGEAFLTTKNYYPFCRSLHLASQKMIQDASKELESNATLMKLRDTCSGQCPYISKMIEASAKMGKVAMNWFNNVSGAAENMDIADMMEILLRQSNQQCDWYSKAICTVRNLPDSCKDFLAAVDIDPIMFQDMTDQCEYRAPCAKKCFGVEAHLVDYTTSQFKMMNEYPVPSKKETALHCSSKDELLKCVEHEECNKFLTSKMFHQDASEKLHSWDETCKWYDDKCVATREEKCTKEVENIRGDWMNKGCAFFFQEKCCEGVQSLAECDAKNSCETNLAEGIPLLESGLEQNIAKNCPKVASSLHFKV